jgi:hypothetical protein
MELTEHGSHFPGQVVINEGMADVKKAFCGIQGLLEGGWGAGGEGVEIGPQTGC